MKKILFVLAVASFSTVNVNAQATKTKVNVDAQTTKTKPVAAVNQTEDLKAVLVSKVVEFKANMARNNTSGANQAYMSTFELMYKAIAANGQILSNSKNGEARTKAQKTIDAQQALYGEIKMFASDMTKNQNQIISKLEDFIKTL